MGIARILGTYYSTCIPALGRQAPARPTVTMMRRIDHLVPGSMNAMWSTWFPNEPPAYNAWTAVVAEEQDRGEPVSLSERGYRTKKKKLTPDWDTRVAPHRLS